MQDSVKNARISELSLEELRTITNGRRATDLPRWIKITGALTGIIIPLITLVWFSSQTHARVEITAEALTKHTELIEKQTEIQQKILLDLASVKHSQATMEKTFKLKHEQISTKVEDLQTSIKNLKSKI